MPPPEVNSIETQDDDAPPAPRPPFASGSNLLTGAPVPGIKISTVDSADAAKGGVDPPKRQPKDVATLTREKEDLEREIEQARKDEENAKKQEEKQRLLEQGPEERLCSFIEAAYAAREIIGMDAGHLRQLLASKGEVLVWLLEKSDEHTPEELALLMVHAIYMESILQNFDLPALFARPGGSQSSPRSDFSPSTGGTGADSHRGDSACHDALGGNFAGAPRPLIPQPSQEQPSTTCATGITRGLFGMAIEVSEGRLNILTNSVKIHYTDAKDYFLREAQKVLGHVLVMKVSPDHSLVIRLDHERWRSDLSQDGDKFSYYFSWLEGLSEDTRGLWEAFSGSPGTRGEVGTGVTCRFGDSTFQNVIAGIAVCVFSKTEARYQLRSKKGWDKQHIIDRANTMAKELSGRADSGKLCIDTFYIDLSKLQAQESGNTLGEKRPRDNAYSQWNYNSKKGFKGKNQGSNNNNNNQNKTHTNAGRGRAQGFSRGRGGH